MLIITPITGPRALRQNPYQQALREYKRRKESGK
jgi:hypothetical protein